MTDPSGAASARELRAWRIGVTVRCLECGRTKKPLGRDSQDNGLCDHGCSRYYDYPRPDSLWPGETETQFGYPVGDYRP